MISRRLILSAILLVGVTVFPLWVSIAVSLVGLIYYRNFYEVVFAGLLIDITYGVVPAFSSNLTFVATAVAVLSLVVFSLAKKALIFYQVKNVFSALWKERY